MNSLGKYIGYIYVGCPTCADDILFMTENPELRRIAGHVCYSKKKVIFRWSSIYYSSTEDPSSVQALLINSDRQRKTGILVILFYSCQIELLISDLLEQIRMKVE